MSCVAQTAPTAAPLLVPVLTIATCVAAHAIGRAFTAIRTGVAKARASRALRPANAPSAKPAIDADLAPAAA